MMECIHIQRGKRSRLGALHCSNGCTVECEQLRLLIYRACKKQVTLNMQTLCICYWLRTVITADTKSDSHSQFIFLYLIPFFFFLTCRNLTKIHWRCPWANMSHIHQIHPLTLFDSDTLCTDHGRNLVKCCVNSVY